MADPRLSSSGGADKGPLFLRWGCSRVCVTESYCFVSSCSCTVLFVNFKHVNVSLMPLLLRRERSCPEVERGSAPRLERCRRSSKPECAGLVPIRGLSLASRHWQHREKRKNCPSGIHLTSLFCLGTLETSLPSPSHTHHTNTHAHIQTHTAVMTACRWTTWAHTQKWAHIRKALTHFKHIHANTQHEDKGGTWMKFHARTDTNTWRGSGFTVSHFYNSVCCMMGLYYALIGWIITIH